MRRVIEAMKINESEGVWFLDEAQIKKMMQAVLDGEHDKVDWLEEDAGSLLTPVRDFFTKFRERTSELTNSSGTPSQSSN